MTVLRGVCHCLLIALGVATLLSIGTVRATDLNPQAISIQLPKQLTWTETPDGAFRTVLRGDITKAGPYIALQRWPAHHMSHPHYHPNDRFITVVSGTWWVGTGPKFEPNNTVALPQGSFVTHFAKQVHYDGAKDGDCVLEIVGEGPAPSIPAEEK